MSGDSTRSPLSRRGPVTMARWGSHRVIWAPITLSLSVKINRFSNIHSWMSTEPSDWVARARAMLVRSAGKAGHGPSCTLHSYSPTSFVTTSFWPPGTTTSSPSSSVRRPRRSKTRRIMRRSWGTVFLTRSSPPVTPARAMNEPISMWSGATSCWHPRRRSAPVTVSMFEPIPWMSAPIFTSMRARSWMWGSQAAFPSSVVPGVSAAAIRAFSVAITEGSSMNTSPARRPPGGAQHDVSRDLDDRTHRPEGVEVRIQAPASDHVAARRRHLDVPVARQERAGEEERGADPLGQLAGGRGVRIVHRRGVDGDLVLAAPLDPRSEVLEQPDHRVHVADARHIAQHDLLLGEEAGREQGQRGVLVPGRGHGARQRDAAFDDELLHGRAPARGPAPGPAAGLG
jgi:hypothetical protein